MPQDGPKMAVQVQVQHTCTSTSTGTGTSARTNTSIGTCTRASTSASTSTGICAGTSTGTGASIGTGTSTSTCIRTSAGISARASTGQSKIMCCCCWCVRSCGLFAVLRLTASLRPKAAPAGGGLRRKGAHETRTNSASSIAIVLPVAIVDVIAPAILRASVTAMDAALRRQ